METYFNIRYEFSRDAVHNAIASQMQSGKPDYICVADGVILDNVNRDEQYRAVVNGGMFSICDSSYVPLYIKWLYGKHYNQYCGSQIFGDIVRSCKYRMYFLGSHQQLLDALQTQLMTLNPDVASMRFVELPFLPVEKFDYASIARDINDDGAEIIWVALGAPKQEQFMARLKPHLRSGVMIAVGAAFKFYSGMNISRAPQWMLDCHLEFVHRIYKEPKKQLRRCWGIVSHLTGLLWQESRRKRANKK